MQEQHLVFVRGVIRQGIQAAERDVDGVRHVPALEFLRRADVDDERARAEVLLGEVGRHERKAFQGEKTHNHEGDNNNNSPVHKMNGAAEFQSA